MKQIKNATLAVLGGLLILSVATVSCSKKSSSPATPTIGSISPNTTDSVGTVITITGTNFTSSSTVTIGGISATPVTFVSSTQITVKVPSGVSVGTAAVVVTTGSEASTASNVTVIANASTYTTPDGLYTSSDQVGTTSLIAYWPFNGNSTEHFSSLSGTTISGGPSNNGTVAYVTGQRGQGISFTNAGLIFPPIPNLDSINQLQRYTVSMWVNMPPNNTAEYPAGSPGEESSLFQVNGDFFNDVWGLCAVEVKTNNNYTGDTLGVSAELTQIDGTAPYTHTDDTTAVLNPRAHASQYFGGANKWSFITETYDDATDSVYIYGNGQLLLASHLNILLNVGETFTLNPNFGVTSPYANNQVTFGSFQFSNEFGASNPYTTGAPYGYSGAASAKPYWTHGINASLDEVRVFNTVLSAAQINDLYLLGSHGQ
jgi:uncharacterized protein (TIGR03437 family)